MSGANEAELAALQDERHDLYDQLVGMTKEYVTAIMPLLSRLRAVGDTLEKIPGGL
jgi:hypothetical protein